MLTLGKDRCLLQTPCSCHARLCSTQSRVPAAAYTTRMQATTENREDRQLELEARIAAKTEQLLALERKVQALEALQEKQLKAAAVLKQLRLIDSKANKPQVGQPEQWMQQSWAHKSAN